MPRTTPSPDGPTPAPACRGRPPRTVEQRAEQRADLVDRAIEAIRTGGADQSLDDMAATMGVSKPVLYEGFGGRHGLADAIAVVLAERVEQTVLDRIGASVPFAIGPAVRAVVETLVDLVEDEPEVYAFLVRSVRTSDRRFLDNALVRVIHERTSVLLGAMVQGMDVDELNLLVDGVYGFAFAAVESWQAAQRPTRDRMVELVASHIVVGLESLFAPPAST